MSEQEAPVKLMFGLSPLATIINSIVLVFISSLIYSVKLFEQVPDGMKIYNLPENFKFSKVVPWYYDMPITIMAIVLGLSWVEYTFKLDIKNFNWKSVRYRYLYLVGGILILQAFFKIILISILSTL